MSSLRRAAMSGLEESRSVCAPAGGFCDMLTQDCRGCPRMANADLVWVCSFCEVGRHAWPGARRDVAVPGAYSSGVCSRCGQERMILIGCYFSVDGARTR